jgi:AcrR family transcriptional regulator
MTSEKERLKYFCQELFLREGFYKISMDEIARDLKMSKKTIYKYFPTKQLLVKEVVFDFIENNKKTIKEIVEQKQDAVTKFHFMIQFVAEILMRGGEKLFGEVQKHMPDLWKEIDAFRVRLMGENISKIIEQGKKEKYFIKIPTALVLNIFISALRGVVTPQFLMNNKFSAVEALNYTIKILMLGIVTEKGKKIFNRLHIGE